MLELFSEELKIGKYKTILVSTTAKESKEMARLPDKELAGMLTANFLITNEEMAVEFFSQVDGCVETILIDVERKKGLSLMEIAKEVICKTKVLPYKPNDVTLEAADQLVLYEIGVDLTGSHILIYGTGNLAFKLALRLLEREADVSIVGRDNEKVHTFIKTLNMIKPQYANALAQIHKWDKESCYDGVISFVSSEQVVDASIVRYIKAEGFAIDGGIGNFQGEFIKLALEKEISVLRLDVRVGNPFLEASIQSFSDDHPFFKSVIGSRQFGTIKLVAGGIIGEAGSIIVDRIQNPTQIIGIANGYGGLKHEKQLTKIDRDNLQYARKAVL